MSKVITISRQYGSGGKEMGEKLAKRLGIPFYGKELIAMIAEEGDIEPAIWKLTMTWNRMWTVFPFFMVPAIHRHLSHSASMLPRRQ